MKNILNPFTSKEKVNKIRTENIKDSVIQIIFNFLCISKIDNII